MTSKNLVGTYCPGFYLYEVEVLGYGKVTVAGDNADNARYCAKLRIVSDLRADGIEANTCDLDAGSAINLGDNPVAVEWKRQNNV